MQSCELTEEEPPEIWEPFYGVWCLTHEKNVNHVDTDGDTPICEVAAKLTGCNCCKENDSKRNRVVLEEGSEIVVGNKVFVLALSQINENGPSWLIFQEQS